MDSNWTTNKPTVEGWYWAKIMFENRWDEVRAVRVISSELAGLEVYGDEVNYNIDDFTHWIGPIKEPDSPTMEE